MEMEMKIRSLLLATAFAASGIASAQAADLSAPVYTKAPPAAYVPQAYNWTGFYVGAHLGGAWSSANWTDPVSGLNDNPTSSGVTGGGQVGANYQFGQWVLGLEADFSGTDLNASDTDAAGFSHATNTYWTSTVTGRVGYAVDRWLIYGKGGVAIANERDTVTSPLGVSANSGTTTQTGWTAGGGVEYAIDRNWSARIEYDYLGFGNQSVSGPVIGTAPGSVDMNIQRVVAGISYKF
jgi:outer membrane immunogenic protein